MARLSYVVRKMYCEPCDRVSEELVSRDGGPDRPCHTCGTALVRAATLDPPSVTVIDDVLWGGPRWIENLGPTPVWCETKSGYKAELVARGMRQQVRHVPVPGTDKSPMTTSWDIGSAPGHDPRPFCMLSPDEQRVRRAEAAERLACSVDDLDRLAVIDPTVQAFVQRADSAPTSCCEFTPD